MSPMEMTFCPFVQPDHYRLYIFRMQCLIKWVGLALALYTSRKMPGVELSVSWKGRLASASLHVDIDESTTCRDLLEQLVNEGWGRKGACHLVERWQRCGKTCPRSGNQHRCLNMLSFHARAPTF